MIALYKLHMGVKEKKYMNILILLKDSMIGGWYLVRLLLLVA